MDAVSTSAPRYKKTRLQYLYLDTWTGVYQARATDRFGMARFRTLDTKNFALAKEKLNAKVTEIRGGVLTPGTMRELSTFRQAADILKARVSADTALKPSSLKYRLATIDGLFRSWPELDRLPLRSITMDDCLEWAKRYSAQVHGTRYNNTVGSLRMVLEIAKAAGVIPANPARTISKVTPNAKCLALPTLEQFHRIVNEIRNSGAGCAKDCADAAEFLVCSGLRITEAINVRPEHVEYERGRIAIYGDPVTGTKGNETRYIPIIPAMRDLLKRLAARDYIPRDTSRLGYLLYVREIYKSLRNACETVGVKKLDHHSIRHLFTTLAIQQKIDIPTVAKWLGHKDGGALLMRTYSHLIDDHSQLMAKQLRF